MAVREYDFLVNVETDSLPNQGTIDSVKSATKSANYQVLDDDALGTIIFDTGGTTLTLPTAADNLDRRLYIINDSTGVVTVDGEGAETIDGETSITLDRQYDTVALQCDGTEWFSITHPPANEIQDFTVIGSVGDTAQQAAGHIPPTDFLGTGTDIAYYKFASGAMTTDEEGAYTLSDNGSVANTTGILNTNFAASFNGTTQYFTQATLLDTIPTKGWAISVWAYFDTIPGSDNVYIFDKRNVAGPDERMECFLDSNSILSFTTTVSGTETITSVPNIEAGKWYHIVATHDTTYGMRLFVDGIFVSGDSSVTTMIANGTATDFYIGARLVADRKLDGSLAQFTVIDVDALSNDYIEQYHVDLLYATKYDRPAVFVNDDFHIEARIQEDGNTGLEHPIEWNLMEVKRDSNYIYRSGTPGFSSTDKLRLVGRK